MSPSQQTETPAPRRLDPEDAQLALKQVQELLRRQHLVEEVAHRQAEGDKRAALVENLLHRQHETELKAIVDDLHP
ncbi:hypothetical protein JYB64_27030, partial [Algoriphagus aestuarii]|nr:hypothetical protein [Algoriphagus aestuarii]